MIVAFVLGAVGWFVLQQVTGDREPTPAGPSPGAALARYIEGSGGERVTTKDGFRATFPTEPKREVLGSGSRDDALTVVSYRSVAAPESVSVLVADYADHKKVVMENLLREAVEGIAKQTKGKIESTRPILFKGDTALDYLVSFRDGFASGRVVVHERRFYQIHVTSPVRESRVLDPFVESFELT